MSHNNKVKIKVIEALICTYSLIATHKIDLIDAKPLL